MVVNKIQRPLHGAYSLNYPLKRNRRTIARNRAFERNAQFTLLVIIQYQPAYTCPTAGLRLLATIRGLGL